MNRYVIDLNQRIVSLFKNRIFKSGVLQYSLVFSVVLLLTLYWFRGGLDSLYLDTDLGRDLGDMSALWIGQKVIWLGPRLSPGLHASPIFYYIFYIAIWISQGNAQSIVFMNLLISAFVLLVYGILSTKKYGLKILIAMVTFGLTPWWQSFAMHPGNGYTYVAWLFLALTLIWFEYPLLLSAFVLGLATSYHPAAIFALIYLLYDWWSRDRGISKLVLMGGCFLLPWAPIIVFEIITKGYLIRHFLDQPGSPISLGWGSGNLIQISLNQLSTVTMSIILWVATGIVANSSKKSRFWFFGTTGLLFIFGFSPEMRSHYLLGISCIFLFVMVQLLISKRVGVLILTGFCLWLLYQSYFNVNTPKRADRTISKISNVVTRLDNSQIISRSEKFAVIAVLDETAKVPHADDYRYFLRIRDYQILDSQHFPDADKLIMFVEADNFDWENWSTFDIEQFGKKVIESKVTVDDVLIIVFKRG